MVEQQPHAMPAAMDDIEVMAALGVELRFLLLDQQLREAVNRPQGRAQVVGNGIREVFEFLGGGFELGGAGGDALFEMGVELADFLLGPLAVRDVAGDALHPAGLAVHFDPPGADFQQHEAAILGEQG